MFLTAHGTGNFIVIYTTGSFLFRHSNGHTK